MSLSGNCNIRCVLPDGIQEVPLTFPAKWTVDQVKKEIFNDTPRLYVLSRDQFVLALNSEEVFLNENKTFVLTTPTVTNSFYAGKTITVFLYSIQHLQNQRLSQRLESGSDSPTSSPSSSGVHVSSSPSTPTFTRSSSLRNSIIGAIGGGSGSSGTSPTSPNTIRKFTFLPEVLASFDNPDKAGFLKKEGKGNALKSWRRRWCVLKDNFVSYFKSKEDTKPVGVIPLQDAIACVKGEKRNTFVIFSRTRTWTLGADTSKEANEWIEAILKCLESMGKNSSTIVPEKSEQTAYSFANAAKEGWLTKSGGNRKNWKKRWCVLKDMFIYYFTNPQARIPTGAIPLQDCYVEPADEQYTGGRKNGFSIITRHRTYDLFAETPSEMKEWVDIVSSVVMSRSRIAEIKEIEESKAVWKKNVQGDAALCWETKKKSTRLISTLYNEHYVKRAPLPSQDFPSDLQEQFGLNLSINRNLETLLFQYTAERTYEQYKGTQLITAETTSAPLGDRFPAQFAVHFHFLKQGAVKAVKTTGDTTIEAALRQAQQRILGHATILTNNDFEELDDIEEVSYIVKIRGRAEYVLDLSRTFSQFVFVRDALSRRRKVEFCLVERGDMKIALEDHKLALESRRSFQHVALQPSLQDSLADDPDSIQQDCYSISEIAIPFEARIICVEGGESVLPVTSGSGEDKITYIVEASLYLGRRQLGLTSKTAKQQNPLWGERVVNNKIRVQNLPLETRACFTFYVCQNNTETPLAWVNMYLFDSMGTLASGLQKLRMWVSSKADPLGTCEQNCDLKAPILNVELLKPPLPVVYLTDGQCTFHEIRKTPDNEQLEEIERVIRTDPLYWLSEDEKSLMWNFRYFLIYERPSNSLAKLLLSVDWIDPLQVQEMHALLCCWPLIRPISALELLDRDFPDTLVREFAVRCLEVLSDFELHNYLLQLVQVLKWETRHDSPLARFLLRRALQSKRFIGHALFWHLQAELHSNEVRYQLMLEAYLRGCGRQIEELSRQMELVKKLKTIALAVKKVPQKPKRIKVLQAELEKVTFDKLSLPLNPRLEVSGLIIPKCKCMESFTVPLWLVFQNGDAGDPIYVIFKVGDDVRQDVLTLQMIREMDLLWKNEGLDLQLTPYGCVSTGQNMGMIEIVLNSATTADIQKMAGGATAAFSKTPLYNWLQECNKVETAMTNAVENFTLSLAGYCVATYVIGIGDRHNDNIMVSKDGHLFHIDFAHFLGNVMKFAGIKRERTAFVLTKEFAHVMGGEKSADFQRFVQLCLDAYRSARKYSNLFMTLFSLMLSSGLPQLNRPEDLEYLHESFAQEKTEEEAVKLFNELIFDSLNRSTATSVNFAIHILANPGT